MHRTCKSLWICVVFIFALSAAARGQGIVDHSGEVAGTVGFSNATGVSSDKHFTFGGSGAYNVIKTVAAGFEYSYTPLGLEPLYTGLASSEHLQLYGGFVRLSPLKTKRAVPYAVVGMGGANLYAEATAMGLSLGVSRSGLNVSVGGGASIYAGAHWGVRPEFRFMHQQFGSTAVDGTPIPSFGQNNYVATVSVFCQFGGIKK